MYIYIYIYVQVISKINNFKGTIRLMIFDLQGIHEVTDASKLRDVRTFVVSHHFLFQANKTCKNQEHKFVLLPHPFYFLISTGFFFNKKKLEVSQGLHSFTPTGPARGPGFKKLPKASLKEANTARCAGKRCSSVLNTPRDEI